MQMINPPGGLGSWGQLPATVPGVPWPGANIPPAAGAWGAAAAGALASPAVGAWGRSVLPRLPSITPWGYGTSNTGTTPVPWAPAAYGGGTPTGRTTKPPGPSVPTLDAYPAVVAARNAQQAGVAQAKARLAAARRAAIIKYGLNPKDEAILKQLGFGLDATDIAAAEANYASGNAISSRIDQNNTLAQRGIVNNLAARGMLGSGDTGYLSGQQAKSYGNQVYDAQTSLEEYLNGILQQEIDQETAYQQAVDQALTDAWAYQQQLLAQQGSYTGGQYLPGAA